MDRGTSLEKVSVCHEFCPIFVSSCLCEYVDICGGKRGFSDLVMKHFTQSPGILHLKYYLILLRSSGYVTQPCVSWYPIPLLDPARYQVSHFSLRATHSHTNTCREQRGEIVQTVCPSCMGIQMLRLSTPAFPLLSQADICLFKLLLQHPERPSDSF